MAVVGVTEDFEAWLRTLDKAERKTVLQIVKLLEMCGVQLGAPYSSALEGTDLPLRELRPKQGQSPLRIVYAFDPNREALLLCGGDKSGDNRFYERIIKKAEQLWKQHLADLEEERKK